MDDVKNLELFETSVVPGNVKAAMKEINAASRDLWQVDIEAIRVIDGFNVRIEDESYRAHVRNIAESIKLEGFYQDKPLSGYVAREDGKQVVYITDGHTRLKAAKIAVSEGAPLTRLPVVVASKDTSIEDLTVSLVRNNSGRPLTPYETAIVCKRLSRFNWDTKQIAERLSFTATYVDGLLLLMAAPPAIRAMVEQGQVAAGVAIEALRQHGDQALAKLQAALDKAQAAGSSKVTAKHMPGAVFKKEVKKAAPKLFNTAREIRRDPGYRHLSPAVRKQLDDLIEQLDQLEKGEQD